VGWFGGAGGGSTPTTSLTKPFSFPMFPWTFFPPPVAIRFFTRAPPPPPASFPPSRDATGPQQRTQNFALREPYPLFLHPQVMVSRFLVFLSCVRYCFLLIHFNVVCVLNVLVIRSILFLIPRMPHSLVFIFFPLSAETALLSFFGKSQPLRRSILRSRDVDFFFSWWVTEGTRLPVAFLRFFFQTPPRSVLRRKLICRGTSVDPGTTLLPPADSSTLCSGHQFFFYSKNPAPHRYGEEGPTSHASCSPPCLVFRSFLLISLFLGSSAVPFQTLTLPPPNPEGSLFQFIFFFF